jgi:hypothetical protein
VARPEMTAPGECSPYAADVEMPGDGRALIGSAYVDDDGAPDPAVREALAAGRIDLQDLCGARLLVAVVAVADAVDAETGADKDSHMAIVSMVNASGKRGLLAFTGLDALQRWQPDARPVPVRADLAAQAALDDGADALVIDVQGPVPYVVTEPALTALATCRDLTPDP